ncbi:hypothetical protein Tco_0306282, partial [Tanacetum coccineum]
MSGAME